MAEVSAAVDHELDESRLAEHFRHDVHEIALPRRSDVDHEWTPCDERRAVPDDVLRPGRSLPGVRPGSDQVGRWFERIRRSVAKELEVTADERIHGTSGRRVDPVIEIEERN